MNTQPEALQLADILEDDSFEHLPVSLSNISSELRRLSQVETENRERIIRLEAALVKANSQAEHFEREWYLRGDRIEELEAALKSYVDTGVKE